MVISAVKSSLKAVAKAVLQSVVARRNRQAYRERVMAEPITPSFKHDVEAKLLLQFDLPQSPCIDIGANNGFYSTILEGPVGTSNLYIFEPLPHLHAKLKQQFRGAHLFDYALSDREGTQSIRVPYINGNPYYTRATLNDHTEAGQTDTEEIAVQLVPLDKVVSDLGLDAISVIKIDVEGHEHAVIQGALETIKRFKPLLMVEIEVRHHDEPISTIFSTLESIGYRGFYIRGLEFRLSSIAEFDPVRDQAIEHLESRRLVEYFNNFLFVHESAETEFVTKVERFLEQERQRAQATPLTK